MTITQEQLFERLVGLRTDILVANEDIKQLKADTKYHKDDNPNGIEKEEVSLIDQAAALKAKQNFADQFEKANAVFEKYRELVKEG